MHAPNSKLEPIEAQTERPTFVIGYYRSGTSLLHALLNCHPSIRLIYESDCFKLWPVVRRNHLHSDWKQRLEFWNQTFSRHKLELSTSGTQSTTGRQAVLEIYHRYAQQTNASVYGVKSACYHDYLPQLAEMFPHARFVIIWRSPLEILQSIRRAGQTDRFFSRADFSERIVPEIKTFVRDVRKLKAAGVSICEIQYDDLVSNPGEALKPVCKFLGLQFDPEMLDLANADVSMVPKGEHHNGVRSGKIGKIKRNDKVLTREEYDYVNTALESLPGAPWKQNSDWEASAWEWTPRQRICQWRTQLRQLLIAFLYAWVPLKLLRKLRQLRSHQTATESAPKRIPAVPVALTLVALAAISIIVFRM